MLSRTPPVSNKSIILSVFRVSNYRGLTISKVHIW